MIERQERGREGEGKDREKGMESVCKFIVDSKHQIIMNPFFKCLLVYRWVLNVKKKVETQK